MLSLLTIFKVHSGEGVGAEVKCVLHACEGDDKNGQPVRSVFFSGSLQRIELYCMDTTNVILVILLSSLANGQKDYMAEPKINTINENVKFTGDIVKQYN